MVGDERVTYGVTRTSRAAAKVCCWEGSRTSQDAPHAASVLAFVSVLRSAPAEVAEVAGTAGVASGDTAGMPLGRPGLRKIPTGAAVVVVGVASDALGPSTLAYCGRAGPVDGPPAASTPPVWAACLGSS